jgi:hypothetical protein
MGDVESRHRPGEITPLRFAAGIHRVETPWPARRSDSHVTPDGILTAPAELG